jgi:hypothetical protein
MDREYGKKRTSGTSVWGAVENTRVAVSTMARYEGVGSAQPDPNFKHDSVTTKKRAVQSGN